MNRIAILLAGALALMGSAVAQETPRERTRGFAFTQEDQAAGPAFNMLMLQRDRMPEQIEFFSAEMAAGGEVVTNAPYTATAVTETTQALADGNRIVNKSSGFVARDSQGRTRREITLQRLGPLQVDSPKTFFINDPTTHTQYVLTQGGEAAKTIRTESTWSSGPTIINIEGRDGRALKEKIVTGRLRDKSEENPRQVKHEDLGMQTIEGVSAEGKRETVTIPAGQIGNERPIEIVTEIWSSPELHTVVLRKHTDPRMGETIFRLTDIKRGEPDASLFQPPPGTKIRTNQMFERKREPAQPMD